MTKASAALPEVPSSIDGAPSSFAALSHILSNFKCGSLQDRQLKRAYKLSRMCLCDT